MTRSLLSCAVLFGLLALSSCSKDGDPAGLKHVGDKWLIASSTYSLVQIGPSSAIKNGTKSNIGAFYFNGSNGSFDITIDDVHKEDVFSFTENGNDVDIISITQSVGVGSISQYVIVLTGQKTSATTMELSGSITKQSTASEFVLSGSYSLTKAN